ncbi:MAG: hypothetical protein MK135_16450, partial [Polyangiaceae bacterium]|nr:hypothetical protein [Polyangiaceae bacterium]
MTEIIRRIVWRIPLLLLAAFSFFALFSTLPQVRKSHLWPLFLNSTPYDAQLAAERALTNLVEDRPGAARRLAELGGAALPILLPQLPTLSLHNRKRLAVALWPVAERMGLEETAPLIHQFQQRQPNAEPLSTASPDDKLVFWERFYSDRSLDFKPAPVERLVKRLSNQSLSLRSADLKAVDTYALPSLIEALGKVETKEDAQRVARLTTFISKATGRDWRVFPEDNQLEARQVATEIRRYWDRAHPDYISMTRLELLAAELKQTEFSIWLFRSLRELRGLDNSPVAARLEKELAASLPSVLMALLGSLVLAPLVVGSLYVVFLGKEIFRLRRWGLRLFLSASCALSLFSVLRLAPIFPAYLPLFMAVLATSHAVYLFDREVADRVDWRAHHVLRGRHRLSRIATVTRWLAPSIPTFAPLLTAELALWLVFAENATLRPGWGFGL